MRKYNALLLERLNARVEKLTIETRNQPRYEPTASGCFTARRRDWIAEPVRYEP